MLTLGGSIGLACGDWVKILTVHVPTAYISTVFTAFALAKDLLILNPIL